MCFLNLLSFALCTTASDQSESRKTAIRSASAVVGSSAHLNSLQSSQDSIAKQQQLQQSQQQSLQQTQQSPSPQTYTRISPEYSSIAQAQPHSTIYTQLQTGQPTTATGGYFISVNPQHGQSALGGGKNVNKKYSHNLSDCLYGFIFFFLLCLGPTPVIMQYLPQNAQTGPIQYLQLIPTRPLIVPISPYMSPFNNPYSGAPSGPTAQASTVSPYATVPQHHHHSYPVTTSHSYGNNYQPTLQSPIGGFSTNYLTYFRPNPGMQLVNGPMDLSLNTNEYLPLQTENSYKVRRV